MAEKYTSYLQTLDILNLKTLESRRVGLCLRFALKAEKHPKFHDWFKLSIKTRNTRLKVTKYVPGFAHHIRFQKSPFCYLTSLLNDFYS